MPTPVRRYFSGCAVGEAWYNPRGQPMPGPDADTLLQLWHPMLALPAELLAWRELLERRQLRQPLKQVFREVVPAHAASGAHHHPQQPYGGAPP